MCELAEEASKLVFGCIQINPSTICCRLILLREAPPSMDFFRKQVEAAQAQARLAASTAGKLAEQLTDQTKVLAEQASTFGKATAEQVGRTAP